jgi:hypothetical protein
MHGGVQSMSDEEEQETLDLSPSTPAGTVPKWFGGEEKKASSTVRVDIPSHLDWFDDLEFEPVEPASDIALGAPGSSDSSVVPTVSETGAEPDSAVPDAPKSARSDRSADRTTSEKPAAGKTTTPAADAGSMASTDPTDSSEPKRSTEPKQSAGAEKGGSTPASSGPTEPAKQPKMATEPAGPIEPTSPTEPESSDTDSSSGLLARLKSFIRL